MKLKFFASLVLALLCGGVASAAPAKNLLRNGDFRSRTDFWHCTMPKECTMKAAPDAERGKPVMVLTVPEPGMTTYQGVIQGVKLADVLPALAEGQSAWAVYTVDCRREGLTGRGSCVGVKFFGGKALGGAETAYENGTHGWKTLKIVKKIPDGATNLHVTAFIAPQSCGVVALDNAVLTIEIRKADGTVVAAAPVPAAAPAKNWLRNGDFRSRTDFWHCTMPKECTMKAAPDAERGKPVMVLTVPEPGMTTYQGVIQGVKLTAPLKLGEGESAWAVYTVDCRREGLTGRGSCVGLKISGEGGKALGGPESAYENGTHGWKTLKIVKKLPDGVTGFQATAFIAPRSCGVVALDNAVLTIEIRKADGTVVSTVAPPVVKTPPPKASSRFRLPPEKQELGWFFSPGEEVTAAFAASAGEKPEFTVTDFYGNTAPVAATAGADGSYSFVVPTGKPGYFVLKAGGESQSFAVTPDRSRLARMENHFGSNFHLLRISFADGRREVELARRAGIGWIRGACLEWDGCSTREHESQLLGRARPLYEYLERTGMGVLGTLSYSAQYASTAPAGQPRSVWARCAPDYGLLTEFAERHARLLPFVKYWEFMNEPDAELFWKGRYENWMKGSDRDIIADAVDYYKAARKGVVEVTPDASFLYFATTSAIPEGSSYHPFFATTLELGIAPLFDIMNLHYRGDVAKLRELLRPYGADQRPFWVTEVGSHCGNTSSERLQLRNDLVQQLERLGDGAEKVFKYDFRDDGVGGYHEFNFGMIRRDFSPKPNYVGIGVMIGLLHDAKIVGALNVVKNASAGYCKAFAFDSPENGRVNALWLCDAPKAEVTLESPEKSVKVIDVMGVETEVPVRDGRFKLALDDQVVFVKGEITGAPGPVVYPGEKVVRSYPMTPEPLLKNGDITEGTAHWNSSLGSCGTVTAAADPQRNKSVLKISVTPGLTDFKGIWQRLALKDFMTLRPDETAHFVLSADCRREDVVGRGVNIGMNFFDADGKRLKWTESPYRAGSCDWNTITVKGEFPAGTTTLTVNCNFAPQTSGTFLMDNITLAVEVRRKETIR